MASWLAKVILSTKLWLLNGWTDSFQSEMAPNMTSFIVNTHCVKLAVAKFNIATKVKCVYTPISTSLSIILHRLPIMTHTQARPNATPTPNCTFTDSNNIRSARRSHIHVYMCIHTYTHHTCTYMNTSTDLM